MPPIARIPLLILGMLSLIVGVLAGLARLAVTVPDVAVAQAGAHGALMVSAFLGTVISLERAVALGRGWPYLGPLCAGAGGVLLIAGGPLVAVQSLGLAGGVVLTVGSLLILRQQPALYTATLALGALAWLVGSVVWRVSGVVPLAVPWWMAFLVLTIAGERLELTRFLPASAAKRAVFAAVVALLWLGLSGAVWVHDLGLRLFAAGLLALAAWLLRNDIARRTIHQSGLTRFIAACLLSGYAWLAAGALLGMAGGFAPGSSLRDAALHAVFLGFVFSMIFGHAPIIFPAVAKVKLPYHPFFYVPLLALHASLLLRVGADLGSLSDAAYWLPWRQHASVGNGLALLLFVATLLTRILRGRTAAR